MTSSCSLRISVCLLSRVTLCLVLVRRCHQTQTRQCSSPMGRLIRNGLVGMLGETGMAAGGSSFSFLGTRTRRRTVTRLATTLPTLSRHALPTHSHGPRQQHATRLPQPTRLRKQQHHLTRGGDQRQQPTRLPTLGEQDDQRQQPTRLPMLGDSHHPQPTRLARPRMSTPTRLEDQFQRAMLARSQPLGSTLPCLLWLAHGRFTMLLERQAKDKALPLGMMPSRSQSRSRSQRQSRSRLTRQRVHRHPHGLANQALTTTRQHARKATAAVTWSQWLPWLSYTFSLTAQRNNFPAYGARSLTRLPCELLNTPHTPPQCTGPGGVRLQP